jgi:putative cell wall-binding protein
MAATTLLSTGVLLSTAGTASAAGAETGSITALSAPTVFHGILDQPAGSFTLALGPGDVVTHGNTITLTVADNSTATGNIDWNGVPNISVDNVLGDTPVCIEGQACDPGGTAPAIVGGDELVITLNGDSTGATIPASGMPHPQTIQITNVHYDVGPHAGVPVLGTPASGPVDVTGVFSAPNGFTFAPTVFPSSSGNSATNAVVSTSVTAPTIDLNAVTTPGLAIGASNQTAGNWNLLLHSPGPGAEISAGDTVNIVIADNHGDNCDPGTLANPDTVGFAAVPSLTITAGSGVATGTPTATASLSAVNDPNGPGIIHCAGTSVMDMLTITFTNTTPVVLTTSATLGVTIQITGVKYNVSSGAKIIADQGNLDVASIYDLNSVTTLPGGFSTAGAGAGGPSNGDIGGITVVGNTPPADIQLNVTTAVPGGEAVNQPISPITITENFPGALPAGVNGFVCVSLITGGEWDASSTAPTASATNGMTVSAPNVETSGPFAGDSTLEFQVTGGSTTGPATVTLSNLDVSVSQSLFTDIANGLVLVTYGGTDAACHGGITTTTATKAFSVTGRIFGVDADATAAQAFEIANPMPGGNLDAVVATDTDPYDALTASYVAGQTGTGVLLTPTASISTETLNALRIEGVETVYTMGGPLAISSAAIAQLEATPSYFPGGTTQRFNAFVNTTRLLTVIPIFGQTADGTASQAAQFVGNNPLGQPEYQAGYGGAYNDTTGSSGSSVTSAPDLGVNTAVLATDTGFQDAASASVMAYHNSLPLILSPPSALSSDAIAALDNDGIQQVLVMGGPLVINDSVVTQLEGMGISVLRIAGTDATDTSAEAAKFELTGSVASGQNAGLGYSTSLALGLPSIIGVNLQSLSFARGDFYSDAIVSAQINSILQSPELLSENPTTLGTPVATFLGLEGNPATAFGSTQPSGPGGSSQNQFNIVGGQAVFGGPIAFASSLETTINTDIGPDQIPFP